MRKIRKVKGKVRAMGVMLVLVGLALAIKKVSNALCRLPTFATQTRGSLITFSSHRDKRWEGGGTVGFG